MNRMLASNKKKQFSPLLSKLFNFCLRLLFPFHKWLLHSITGKSEIERIISNRTLPYPFRLQQVKNSLQHSKSSDIWQALLNKDCADVNALIVNKKSIKNYYIKDQIQVIIRKIQLYNKLNHEIEFVRKTCVTDISSEHVHLLELLWTRLISNDQPFELKTKQWTKIGFQGSNPLTDFRGMGLFGLLCLEYLSRDTTRCLKYIDKSNDTSNGYSFAIVVINVCSWLYELLSDEYLLTYFSIYQCNLDEFYKLFQLIFDEFHFYWIKQNVSIMEFESVTKHFRKQMRHECEIYRPFRPGFSKCISKNN